MLEYELHHKIINEYLKKELPTKKDISLSCIASEIINKIQDAVQINNATKRSKWRLPNRLQNDEIDIIMRHLFTIKKISMMDTEISSDSYLLAIYDEDKRVYSIEENEFNKKIYDLNPTLTTSRVKDVKNLIYTRVDIAQLTKSRNLVAVNNGIFNQKTKTLEAFDPKYVYLSKIPVDYNPNAQNIKIKNDNDGSIWDIESWIKELSDDAEIQSLLWNILAATIRPNHGWTKAIWFYSEVGNNGKGTFLELIRNLLRHRNIATLKVADFAKQFALESLIGANCVLADENDVNEYIDSCANYKAACTGDRLSIDRKFKSSVDINFKGTIIQCMNGFPKTKDKSNSFYRRLILVPFNKSFEGIEKPYIKSDYLGRKEVLEYVLLKTLNIDIKELKAPQAAEQLLDEYRDYNDHTRQFWQELEPEFVWDLLPNDFLYQLYLEWSKINTPYGKPVNKKTFLSDLDTLLKNDPKWEFKGNKTDYIKTRDKMSATENLIIEYNLVRWMNKTYTGNIPDKITNFEKKQRYRRVVRR